MVSLWALGLLNSVVPGFGNFLHAHWAQSFACWDASCSTFSSFWTSITIKWLPNPLSLASVLKSASQVCRTSPWSDSSNHLLLHLVIGHNGNSNDSQIFSGAWSMIVSMSISLILHTIHVHLQQLLLVRTSILWMMRLLQLFLLLVGSWKFSLLLQRWMTSYILLLLTWLKLVHMKIHGWCPIWGWKWKKLMYQPRDYFLRFESLYTKVGKIDACQFASEFAITNFIKTNDQGFRFSFKGCKWKFQQN